LIRKKGLILRFCWTKG